MSHEANKRRAAREALERVGDEGWIGVGTGSTTNHFIDLLATIRERVRGAVASSAATAERLRATGIPVVELNDVGRLPLYVDGADEATRARALVKGGGGALTREKIIATASRRFICILDESKLVDRLGRFPLAVEVIPMATRVVAEQLAELGGRPVLRRGFVSDNGNRILDVHGLRIDEPGAVEEWIDRIAGVVSNGLFCRRPADELIVGTERGVLTI